MKKIYLVLIIVLLSVGILYTSNYFLNRTAKNTVSINGKKINVEIAKTDAEREKGLMNRNQLDADSGMLFVFEKAEIQTFWMKNTLIPLDIIWINSSPLGVNKIVEITTLDPDSPSYTPQYTPENKANYVLELNAGAVNENGFKIGDKVKINY